MQQEIAYAKIGTVRVINPAWEVGILTTDAGHAFKFRLQDADAHIEVGQRVSFHLLYPAGRRGFGEADHVEVIS